MPRDSVCLGMVMKEHKVVNLEANTTQSLLIYSDMEDSRVEERLGSLGFFGIP